MASAMGTLSDPAKMLGGGGFPDFSVFSGGPAAKDPVHAAAAEEVSGGRRK
jgi:hypothetical protein